MIYMHGKIDRQTDREKDIERDSARFHNIKKYCLKLLFEKFPEVLLGILNIFLFEVCFKDRRIDKRRGSKVIKQIEIFLLFYLLFGCSQLVSALIYCFCHENFLFFFLERLLKTF